MHSRVYMKNLVISGNLTKDIELKYLPSGTACANFGLAVNKKTKKGETVSFFNCTLFGKRAEILNQYKKKGDPLLIQGEPQINKWQTDGKDRRGLDVNVRDFEFRASGGVNNFAVSGNLTADPELKDAGETKVVNGSIAVNYKTKVGDKYEDRVDFFDFSAFGQRAEFIAKYMKKGDGMFLIGELIIGFYEKDDEKIPTFTVNVDKVSFMNGKKDEDGVKADKSDDTDSDPDELDDLDEMDELDDLDELD